MAHPSPAARRVTERVDAHRAKTLGAIPPAPTAEAALGFSHQPGDRVVDLVTGEEVTVHAVHRTAEIVPAARPELD
jgi:hypothetical protein